MTQTPHHNRLQFEKSPYLLQHADNPVDWYPWGEEAFAKARSEHKPIFLSIGYSTCHWCHVMAHESFEDSEVARRMNEVFVSIKVDREERPDIDNIYMTVCQLLTGSGGWPLTIVMTPDRRPFFAGTYFPKTSRFGRIGMVDLVPRIHELWTTDYDKVLRTADQVIAALRQHTDLASSPQQGEVSSETDVLNSAYTQLAGRFDHEHGGFGTAPKFPTPHTLLFLLRHWHRHQDEQSLAMVEQTLQAMRLGGMYDHIGFGFHRYSTDARWLLPHFEKMLYDQALLAMAYLEAYQATGNENYSRVAREIFTYVLRDMTAPEGGFYSAEDADSEGVEGKFYLWTPAELRQILSQEDTELVLDLFHVEPQGNFREQATGVNTGDNILHLQQSLSEIAAERGIPEAMLRDSLEQIRQQLFDVREQRIHPHKDDKILTDWNGLMIAALAKGGQALDEPMYTEAAQRAAHFLLETMRRSDGRLVHRYRDGEAAIPAHVDDYAFLIWGLIDLYEATLDAAYLEHALALNRDLLEHFWDDEQGGLYFTAEDGEALPVRQKELYDGALPSGNSVAALNWLRLARITADPTLEESADRLVKAFAAPIAQQPSVYTVLMLAIDFGIGPAHEVVIAGDPQADDTRQMLHALRTTFLPNKVLVFRPTTEASPAIVRVAPYVEPYGSIDGNATAYVCQNQICRLPTTAITVMLDILRGKQGE
ncbi:DUF255 domain-containing protein [candidate division KSB3 bacterium]|uniref:DUF255 domain-containing protein n=1 Tax=candidate division KSB3 bacterium TaxID=2044937 RepID=A0A9D5Q7E6_9BACT|nr:DUF255 domain-containing protein [candidate division KSB3 bacterium]MBD3326819.1 DUF255 domain-containing protein [candidate division KSB3 bacterium]